jgi:hypothetical protein
MPGAEMYLFLVAEVFPWLHLHYSHWIQIGMKFTSFILEVSFNRFFYGIVGIFHWILLAIRKINLYTDKKSRLLACSMLHF